MRFGIPVIGSRIAPRCTIAEALLLVVQGPTGVAEERVPIEGTSWLEVLAVLTRYRVDTLVCNGIRRDERAFLEARSISVIENVASSTDRIVNAIVEGRLEPGFGFGDRGSGVSRMGSGGPTPADRGGAGGADGAAAIDCLTCRDRVCLRGSPCWLGTWDPRQEDEGMLDAAQDIACEEERILCRLSELIYFCLEMNYRKIGVAYCLDLAEPCRTLVGLLRRHFDVSAVCCKVGGIVGDRALGAAPATRPANGHDHIVCNPAGQAGILKKAGCELNVMVGLCMGVDCVFARASEVPVTALFVKDRSLANNPIGAVYSDHYRKEASLRTITRTES